jgi:hypothetical protein
MHPMAAQMRADLHNMGIETRNLSVRQLEFIAVEQQVTNALNQELLAYGFTSKALEDFAANAIRVLAQQLAQKAQMKSLEQVAEALSSLAEWDFAGAAKHFAAAAAWEGLAAGISGLAGSAASAVTGGGGGGYGGGAYGRGTGGSTAAGTVSGSGPVMAPGAMPRSQQNITVQIQSDIPYTIRRINHEVVHNDHNLIAMQARKQTPFGGR